MKILQYMHLSYSSLKGSNVEVNRKQIWFVRDPCRVMTEFYLVIVHIVLRRTVCAKWINHKGGHTYSLFHYHISLASRIDHMCSE